MSNIVGRTPFRTPSVGGPRAFGYSDWEQSVVGWLLVVIRVLQVLSGQIIAYFLFGT